MPHQWSLRLHVHWPHRSALNRGVMPTCFTKLFFSEDSRAGPFVVQVGGELHQGGTSCLAPCPTPRESYVTATYSRGFSQEATQGKPSCGVTLKQTCGKYDIYHRVTRRGSKTFADCQCTLRAWRWGPRGLGATVHSHNNARDQSETHNRRSDNCKRAPITNIGRALSCGAWEVDFAR